MRAAGLRGATLRKFVVTTQSRREPTPVAIWSSGASTPNGRIGCGWLMRPTFRPGAGFCTWRSCWMCSRARSSVGRWRNTLHTELMLAAFDMAITMRRPQRVIHHSDHGCQYTSYAFGKRCQEAGIMPSMGTGRGCVRQRHGGILLRHARARGPQPPALQEPGRSQDGDLRLARGLVQSSSAPFCVGLSLAGQLRTSRARARGG